jgi:putative DNA primase/helicase
MSDVPVDFRVAILTALGHAPDLIEPGRLQRFATNGKRADTSGWCLLFDDLHAGVYGCFRAGISETWTSTSRHRMTLAERAALQRRITLVRAAREQEQREVWRRNAERVAHLTHQLRHVIAGDPVHLYLCRRLRAESIVVPECIQFHPALPYRHGGEVAGIWPAMVAPIVGIDGKVRALHRTYLTSEGEKADVPGPAKKLSPAAGPLSGASIRLHEPRAGLLGISEGIETALAASCASRVPTVAAYCAGALAGFLWPSGVQRIVIFADADKAGCEAADGLRARALARHVQCEVLMPSTDGSDWADVWAARAAEVAQ